MLFVVCGLPGSGKTEVARLIGEYTGALSLNTDEIRLRVFDSHVLAPSSAIQWDIVYRVTAFAVELLAPSIGSGKHVVVDGSFRFRRHREGVLRAVPTSLVMPLHVVTDRHLRMERIEARHRRGLHHATVEDSLEVERVFEAPSAFLEFENSGSLEELRSAVRRVLSSRLDVSMVPEKPE